MDRGSLWGSQSAMTKTKAIRLLLLVGITALMLSYPPLYTPWWVAVWALVSLVALLAEGHPKVAASSGRARRIGALAPERQLALSLLLIVATAADTRWRRFGWRDLVLWGWVVFTLGAEYGGAFRWAWGRVRAALRRDA